MFIRYLLILIGLIQGVVMSQNWEYVLTDANMTIQISNDVVAFDGELPPNGALLGAFFINDSGEYVCAGYQEWTGNQLAIALWASESGADNGFAFGESIYWFIQLDNETFEATVSIMNEALPFSSTFVPNGFGQVLELEFFSAGCSEAEACNYCDSCLTFDNSLLTIFKI